VTVADVREKLVETALRIYPSRPERVAVRGALGDAAALCDALARDIEANNPRNRKKGTVTVRGAQLADIARQCGNIIWNMRDKIEVQDT
jgi:hypothetical protein